MLVLKSVECATSCQEHLIDRLGQPIYTGRAAILWHPVFQAGCRGFEPRLPLHSIDRLCAGRSQAAWRQLGSVRESKETMFLCAQRRTATSCLILCIAPPEILPGGLLSRSHLLRKPHRTGLFFLEIIHRRGPTRRVRCFMRQTMVDCLTRNVTSILAQRRMQ